RRHLHGAVPGPRRRTLPAPRPGDLAAGRAADRDRRHLGTQPPGRRRHARRPADGPDRRPREHRRHTPGPGPARPPAAADLRHADGLRRRAPALRLGAARQGPPARARAGAGRGALAGRLSPAAGPNLGSDAGGCEDQAMSNGDRGRPASDGLLVDELAAEIQRQIMEGAVPVGSWLRQEALAKEFGVSRTPVREALQKLEAMGIVELVPYRGALTRGPTARQIRETYEVRAELEGLAAELAAERIRPDQLERLRAAAALFSESVEDAPPSKPQQAGRELPWQRANTMLHEIVQEAAGNERLSAA